MRIGNITDDDPLDLLCAGEHDSIHSIEYGSDDGDWHVSMDLVHDSVFVFGPCDIDIPSTTCSVEQFARLYPQLLAQMHAHGVIRFH